MKKICIVGLGYIGLPTAAVMAGSGLKIIGVDLDESVVDTVNSGKTHIVEPNLEEHISHAVKTGLLTAQKDMPLADAYLIAVPTPIHDDKTPDLDYVLAAFTNLAPVLRSGAIVILQSTCPVGTTDKMRDLLATLRPDLKMPHDNEPGDIAIAFCPECILPGNALYELVHNDRSVGGISPHCSTTVQELYQPFVKGELIITNARTAEMSKLTENAYRDVSIAFANELSLVCDNANIDVWELIRLANHHPRVDILRPGPGVGGHCIAVDPWFIINDHRKITPLMQKAREINDQKPLHVVHKIWQSVNKLELNRPAIIGCLGLAFKADIDDLRSSPAMEIVKILRQSERARILAVEPHISHLPQNSEIELTTIDQCIQRADIIVVLVAHKAFEQINFHQIANIPVLDFVNLSNI